MLNVLSEWFERTFEDQELSILLLTLIFISGLVFFLGGVLAPIIAGVVVAYVLDGGVMTFCSWRVPRLLAIVLVLLLFMGFFIVSLVWFFPLVWQEVSSFVHALPVMTTHSLTVLDDLPNRFPGLISHDQIAQLTSAFNAELAQFGKQFLALTLSVIPSIMELLIYLVLVPLLVFFFLKDGSLIFSWLSDYFPHKRRLVRQVWHEVDGQFGRYIRGKLIEITLVSVVTAISFSYWGLNYPILLGFLVGLSTLIPYVGAVVVSIPVVFLALVQWGVSRESIYLLITYSVIHLLDSQVLIPCLFSEALSIHPIAIFIAIVVFGGLWGFWGIFFAIPLATVVKAVLNAWPRDSQA